MSDLINKDEERQRLQKEIQKLEKDQQLLKQKLGNASFVEKAPAAVVAKDRDRLSLVEQTLEKLMTQLEKIG